MERIAIGGIVAVTLAVVWYLGRVEMQEEKKKKKEECIRENEDGSVTLVTVSMKDYLKF